MYRGMAKTNGIVLVVNRGGSQAREKYLVKGKEREL